MPSSLPTTTARRQLSRGSSMVVKNKEEECLMLSIDGNNNDELGSSTTSSTTSTNTDSSYSTAICDISIDTTTQQQQQRQRTAATTCLRSSKSLLVSYTIPLKPLILVQDCMWKARLITPTAAAGSSDSKAPNSPHGKTSIEFVNLETGHVQEQPPTPLFGFLAYNSIQNGISYRYNQLRCKWEPPIPDLHATSINGRHTISNNVFYQILATDNQWNALCFTDSATTNHNNNTPASTPTSTANASYRRIYYWNTQTQQITWESPNIEIGYLALDAINTGIHYVRNQENDNLWAPPIPPITSRALAYHRSRYSERSQQQQQPPQQQQQSRPRGSSVGRRGNSQRQETIVRRREQQQPQQQQQEEEQAQQRARKSKFQSSVFRRFKTLTLSNSLDNRNATTSNNNYHNNRSTSTSRRRRNNDINDNIDQINTSTVDASLGLQLASDQIMRSTLEAVSRNTTPNGASIEEISMFPCRTLTDPNDSLLKKKSQSVPGSNKENNNSKKSSGYYNCAICLENYNLNDKVRTIPCFHTYHSDCIVPWLLKNSACPMCKYQAVS